MLKSRIKSGIILVGFILVLENIERVESFERFVTLYKKSPSGKIDLNRKAFFKGNPLYGKLVVDPAGKTGLLKIPFRENRSISKSLL